jgi:asparagine synthase (glutamine-hydrolysing)
MSMAHGLETRVPYLDYRLVEWAARLPEERLLNKKEGKLILKQAARSLVTNEVIRRGKWGFTLPLDHWFRGPLRSFLIEAVKVATKYLPIAEKVAASWVDEELSGQRNYSLRLFALCLLGYWLEGEN